MMLRGTKRIAMVGALLLIGAGVAGCTTVSTDSDQVALHYDAGGFSSTTYQECVKSNNRSWDGLGEQYYKYPAGQRNFEFSANEDAESPAFTVVSKDNQELTITGGLTFHLDTSCDDDGGALRAFHEEIGLKFQPVLDDSGKTTGTWLEMLRFYIGQPLAKALTTEAQKYDWLALYNDPATREKFETAINASLGASVKATTGDKAYFEKFNLTLQNPEPRKELVDGLAAVQVAITQRQALVEQNATLDEKLKQIRKLVGVLGSDGYILYDTLQRCLTGEAPKGCPSFLPLPPGGTVEAPAPAPAAS
jgi:outer membrane lipoprotein-sorting protein